MSEQSEEWIYAHWCGQGGPALIAADARGLVRFMNPAAEKLFGRSGRELENQPADVLFPPERREQISALLREALENGRGGELDYRYADPAGGFVYLAVAVVPLCLAAEQGGGACIFICNLTRQMELLREVAAKQKMSALENMAGAMAHHFNNLLGGIVTSIDFAQGSEDPQVLKRALRTAAAALNRADDLTQSLLTFAEGDRSPGPEDQLTAIVETFVEAFQRGLEYRRIVVETDLQPADVTVPTRPMRMILELLMNNACEAMPNGGKVRLELRTGDHEVTLRISDTGPGIDREHLGRIWEPFFTTKGRDKQKKMEHIGLGLTMVYGLVRGLGGTVLLDPGAEGGAVCVIRIPKS